MGKASSKLTKQTGSSPLTPQPPQGGSPATDDTLDANRHSRSYDPTDSAKRGSVSGQLNEDAAKYKNAPASV